MKERAETFRLEGSVSAREIEMEKRLLHVREVATYLGIRPTTVYAWARRQKLPSIKMGGRLLFDKHDLDELIEEKKRPVRTVPEFSR